MQSYIVGIIFLIILIWIIWYYIKTVNTSEWNNGKCPHCEGGYWKKWRNPYKYHCSLCGKEMFKF